MDERMDGCCLKWDFLLELRCATFVVRLLFISPTAGAVSPPLSTLLRLPLFYHRRRRTPSLIYKQPRQARQRTADSGQRTADSRRQTADSGQQTAESRELTAANVQPAG